MALNKDVELGNLEEEYDDEVDLPLMAPEKGDKSSLLDKVAASGDINKWPFFEKDSFDGASYSNQPVLGSVHSIHSMASAFDRDDNIPKKNNARFCFSCLKKYEVPKLVIATLENHFEEVERLLEEGADPNFIINDKTFFHLPDSRQCIFSLVVSEALEKQQRYTALCNPIFPQSWTPLHIASCYLEKECVQILLAAGADPNICDVKGRTALDVVGWGYYYYLADATECFAEIIGMLVEAGGQHNTMKVEGLDNMDSPLHIAAQMKNKDAFYKLIKIGASVACVNDKKQTPLHVCVIQKFLGPFEIIAKEYECVDSTLSELIDMGDARGCTVLHEAVRHAWLPGVCFALEFGADITNQANNGEAPIHSAATVGDFEIMKRIINVAKTKNVIDFPTKDGKTALFKAVTKGNINCVSILVNEGACASKTFEYRVNLLHVAAKKGRRDILELIYKNCDADMINVTTTSHGFNPLHFAALKNRVDCAKFLISESILEYSTTSRTYIRDISEGSTALHIAAVHDHVEIAKLLLKSASGAINILNNDEEFPLHTAIKHNSRDVTALLLKKGANLAGSACLPDTASPIKMLINNISNPTEFLEKVFDSFITTNNLNLLDPSCEVNINYTILMPTGHENEQMNVVEALIETGNRFGQKKLLLHPLVESFVHLKWKALLPFFYMIIACHAFFVTALTIYSLSVFFYKDTGENKPIWINPVACAVLYLSIVLILLQELLHMNVSNSGYLLLSETWMKLVPVVMAVILPPAVALETEDAVWPRHMATFALLLTWIEVMILLSRFPKWGYYVLIFGKVASKVIQILLIFIFLLIGFSLSFMIQFRFKIPFENLFSAFTKTIVMMTSEFDYGNLFDEEHKEQLAFSLQITRLLFVIFLVTTAIVLMNIMTDVAVNDISELELQGNIQTLDKQVVFLNTLDTLLNNKKISKILTKKVCEKIRAKGNVKSMLTLQPGQPTCNLDNQILPRRIRDAIYNIAQEQKQKKEDEANQKQRNDILCETGKGIEEIKNKDFERDESVKKNDEALSIIKESHDDLIGRLNSLDARITKIDAKNTDILAKNTEFVAKNTAQMEELKQLLLNVRN